VPVLINTSFNIKGQPMVETPEDAMDCFLSTGIDCLIMHDMIIEKNRMHRFIAPTVKVYSDVRMIVRSEMGMQ
jgi:carbamoyltransferase